MKWDGKWANALTNQMLCQLSYAGIDGARNMPLHPLFVQPLRAIGMICRTPRRSRCQFATELRNRSALLAFQNGNLLELQIVEDKR